MKIKYRVKWRRILWGVNADRVSADDQALIDWAHSLLPATWTPFAADGTLDRERLAAEGFHPLGAIRDEATDG